MRLWSWRTGWRGEGEHCGVPQGGIIIVASAELLVCLGSRRMGRTGTLMSSSDSPDPPNPPPASPPIARAAPPTFVPQATTVTPTAARWPFAVGVVSIVYACLHILGGVCSVASPLWSGMMRKASPPGTGPDFMAISERWAAWTISLAVVSLGLSGLLLAIGIGMLNRRRWSIGASRYWCVGQMALAVPNGVIGYLMQSDIVHSMSQSGQVVPGAFATGARIGAAVGVIVGLAWGLALPVFLLVWLRRPAVRGEYEGWAARGVR